MDSKANDTDLYREYGRKRMKKMITYLRTNMDKIPARKEMINFMKNPKHKKIYRERLFKVEPM